VTEGAEESSRVTGVSQVGASSLLDEEREAAELLSGIGLGYESHNKEYLSFRDLRERRGRYSSSSRRWFPRAYVPALRSQLGEVVEKHPTSTGLVIPARGYVELICSRLSPIAAKRLFQLQLESINVKCVHGGERASVLPSLPYRWLDDEGESVKRVHLSGADPDPCLEISNASPLAMLLYGGMLETGRVRLTSRRIPFLATLKIAYGNAWDHERIRRSSEATARSLIYELDVRNGVLMELDAPSASLDISLGRGPLEAPRPIRYPSTTIDYEVSVLFGFASQVTDDPPDAFLSYYKALEYFIPKAAHQSAIKNVRRELRDPTFDSADDASLLRLIEAAKGPKAADEQNQIRIVVNEYVRPGRLEEFFDRGWGDYFTHKGPVKGVPAINSRNNLSLSDQVADRVSQIRNRLVHAKDDPKLGDARVLLPRSTAANALTPDVLLVRLLVTEAILVGLSG
jgi:hypothetical protein